MRILVVAYYFTLRLHDFTKNNNNNNNNNNVPSVANSGFKRPNKISYPSNRDQENAIPQGLCMETSEEVRDYTVKNQI